MKIKNTQESFQDRSTAAYDGTAIATSVVNILADLKCHTFISAYYHNLIDSFHKDERITLGQMIKYRVC